MRSRIKKIVLFLVPLALSFVAGQLYMRYAYDVANLEHNTLDWVAQEHEEGCRGMLAFLCTFEPKAKKCTSIKGWLELYCRLRAADEKNLLESSWGNIVWRKNKK
jgi:hypothetical protein